MWPRCGWPYRVQGRRWPRRLSPACLAGRLNWRDFQVRDLRATVVAQISGPCHSVRVEASRPAPDEALACLSALVNSVGELHRLTGQLSQWMSTTTQQAPGLSYGRMLPLDKRLAIVEQLSEAIRVLDRDGNRFRRLEAQALYAEGLTMAQLATVFGVSRQRVSVLLREGGDGTARDGGARIGPAGTLPGDRRVSGAGL